MKRNFHIVGLIVGVLMLCHGGAVFAAASPRIALVIGNSAYKIAPPLPNPANDAKLMAETLRDLGFDVVERIDADRDTMLLAVFDLQDRLIAKSGVMRTSYHGHDGGVTARISVISIAYMVMLHSTQKNIPSCNHPQ